MTNDPAAFDRNALEAIFFENPSCFLSGLQAHDWHHDYGRSGLVKSNPARERFSSVFNAVPISREAHDRCPLLHHPGLREALFDLTSKHVQNAVNAGRYALTEIDEEFLAWQRREAMRYHDNVLSAIRESAPILRGI